MPSALTVIGLAAVLAAGAAAAEGWEHRPIYDDFEWAAPVRWVLPTPLKHFHFATLAGERDHALAATEMAQEASHRCSQALTQANSSAAAAAAQGQAALAAIQSQLAAQQGRDRQYVAASAAAQTFAPTGATACERWESTDAFVRSQLLGLR
jgi:hypothetical protein